MGLRMRRGIGLLLDEADDFVGREAASGFAKLHALRGLSEEGRCHFILAGFWRLYEAATLDYQSPIKNFGETLTIGALEPDACRDLITEPMAALNINYASRDLVDRIVHETGGRANLIAITCNEMLRRLDPNSRILGEADVERGLASRDHVSALAGWENLGGTPRESRLDRIIVYATVERDGFTLGELMRLLDGWDCNFSNEEVKRSLMRLDLAFILGEDAKDGRYRYRVPLFQRMRRRNEEPGLLLERELREART
jgi:hypothetical protein